MDSTTCRPTKSGWPKCLRDSDVEYQLNQRGACHARMHAQLRRRATAERQGGANHQSLAATAFERFALDGWKSDCLRQASSTICVLIKNTRQNLAKDVFSKKLEKIGKIMSEEIASENGQATIKRALRNKKEKTVKRPYPKALLEKAIQIPYKIKELNGGNPWSPALVAKAIGLSPKNTDFYYLSTASRDFGFTEGTRDTATIALTDLGRQLVYAPSPESEHQKRVEGFHKIGLFTKVLQHYKGSNLPDMKYLGNTLEGDFGLAPKFHEEFASVFRENCKYLNIISGSPGPLSDSKRTPTTVTVGEPTKKSGIKAFVIMPFVEKTVERPKGFFAEVLRSLITPAAVAAGFNVQTANRQGSDVIQSTIVNELLEADLVIADLTDHNPNVLFELGLRMASEKPVALIKAAGTGKVFDVDNMLRVHEYQPNLWRTTVETDLPELTKHIAAAWENRTKDQSYMKILRRSVSSGNGSH